MFNSSKCIATADRAEARVNSLNSHYERIAEALMMSRVSRLQPEQVKAFERRLQAAVDDGNAQAVAMVKLVRSYDPNYMMTKITGKDPDEFTTHMAMSLQRGIKTGLTGRTSFFAILRPTAFDKFDEADYEASQLRNKITRRDSAHWWDRGTYRLGQMVGARSVEDQARMVLARMPDAALSERLYKEVKSLSGDVALLRTFNESLSTQNPAKFVRSLDMNTIKERGIMIRKGTESDHADATEKKGWFGRVARQMAIINGAVAAVAAATMDAIKTADPWSKSQ